MKIMFISQVVNGAVLPFVLVFMLLLINDKRLMGRFVNGPLFNTISWLTVIIMILLNVTMTFDMLSPGSISKMIGR
jgi:Mn2+/Fe2+ NRAMP family transporter